MKYGQSQRMWQAYEIRNSAPDKRSQAKMLYLCKKRNEKYFFHSLDVQLRQDSLPEL